MKRWVRKLVGVPLLILAGSALAAAHAFLDHAEPRVGAVLNEPPQQVKIWFTQELEPLFSTLQVLDANGTRVDKGNEKTAGEDQHLIQVDLPSLPAGTYTVDWNVLSVDGHRTTGRFSFTVQ